jgi:TPP-dependent pyruvate/acetoin dehydrogenase alpha subunit
MNLAKIWSLPVIFVCENNGYTEWTATEKLTAGRIADRGQPMGIPGVQVDGNDVLAVRAAVEQAVQRGRAGEGPTLIEALTYRWHGHNEGEEVFAGNYRPEAEQESWRKRDPIKAYAERLIAAGVLDQAGYDALDAEETRAVEAAVASAKASPFPDAEEALDHLYAPVPTGAER